MEWRVYYDDGSTFDSDDGSVQDVPALGVQAVVCHDRCPDSATGRMVAHRFDFYWYEGPEWFGGDLFGLFDYLVRPGMKKVVFGRSMAVTSEHQRIIDRACGDPDFVRRPSR